MNPANKNYLGVGLTGLTIVVFWVFGMPMWNRISLLNAAAAERREILSSRTEILQKIEDLNEQYRERSTDVNKISSVVPNAKSTAELVSTIEATTQQTGLQLVEMTMGGSDSQQQELQTVFLELGLVGSYPSLTAFLDLLEKNLRLIDVFEISVGQTATPGGQAVLNFRVKVNAYYLNVK